MSYFNNRYKENHSSTERKQTFFFFHDTQGKNYGFSEGKLEPLLGYLGQWLKKAIKAAQCRVYVAGYN